jgi:hypothetical protein
MALPTLRGIVLTLLAGAGVIAFVSPGYRRAIARRLSHARRFVSHRIVDEDARASARAVETWEDEGGALHRTARGG